MSSFSDSDFLIVGDFNIPHLTFVNNTDGTLRYVTTQTQNVTNQANIFLNYINELNLYQHNYIKNVNVIHSIRFSRICPRLL